MNPASPRRRGLLQALAAGALLAKSEIAMSQAQGPHQRAIPRSGEMLPVVGLGTYQTFDVDDNGPARSELLEVLRQLARYGKCMIDTSPMYGRAERTVGELTAQLGNRASLFFATKVWTRGRDAGVRQMEESMRLMRTRAMDLMQVHNLLDLDTHLKTLLEWKAAGRIRYLGITHYHSGAYDQLERLVKTRAWDFVQFNYSMAEREAEARLLSVCAESGTAVIINRPFAQASLFGKVKSKPLPPWAAEFDCASWAQFFLKYLLGHPAVTCVIPGTGRVSHLQDNLGAGMGRLPDAALRRRMVDYLERL
jgi:aryl-alcohol dehydrogenase-like predicted oxidoreductase